MHCNLSIFLGNCQSYKKGGCTQRLSETAEETRFLRENGFLTDRFCAHPKRALWSDGFAAIPQSPLVVAHSYGIMQ